MVLFRVLKLHLFVETQSMWPLNLRLDLKVAKGTPCREAQNLVPVQRLSA